MPVCWYIELRFTDLYDCGKRERERVGGGGGGGGGCRQTNRQTDREGGGGGGAAYRHIDRKWDRQTGSPSWPAFTWPTVATTFHEMFEHWKLQKSPCNVWLAVITVCSGKCVVRQVERLQRWLRRRIMWLSQRSRGLSKRCLPACCRLHGWSWWPRDPSTWQFFTLSSYSLLMFRWVFAPVFSVICLLCCFVPSSVNGSANKIKLK